MDSLPYIISWALGGVLTTTAHAGIIYHVHLRNNYDVYMKVSPYKKISLLSTLSAVSWAVQSNRKGGMGSRVALVHHTFLASLHPHTFMLV